ncbi:MAG TPA: ATP-binding protein [Bacillota bacterium]|nr:ATP-binding protein [Bacillota bacterium]
MIKNRLLYKISLGYVVIVLIVLMLVGTVFVNLFRNYSFQEKERNMVVRAREIGKISLPYLSGNVMGREYHDFIELLDTFTSARVWVVDTKGDMAFMSNRQGCRGYGNNLCLGQNMDRDLIAEVLKGQEVVRERYSNFYHEPMIAVGTPIYDSTGRIQGAVFLHAPILGINAAIGRVYFILTLAILLALGLIGIVGVIYSQQITKPLQQINRIALEMAEGNYAVRTNIHQKDEVGQLSHSIDYLAAQLGITINELERLEQMRKDLISNVSHELRTPLTLIRGAAETLIDGMATDENAVRKQYRRILEETKVLERLVNDLLELSKLQAGKFTFQMEPIDLGALVKEVTAKIQGIAAPKKIAIHTVIPEEVPPIAGDYYRLRQLLVIFLDNAIKYSDADSQITVTLRVTEELSLTIQDQGIGIPASELPYIWERFYKVDKAREKNNSGAGLGLTIARYLVEAHHGNVRIDSEFGQGTTVEIRLPMVKEDNSLNPIH